MIVTGALRLDGTMIPRRVNRMFDERGEPRERRGAMGGKATIEWRGAAQSVHVVNVSASGAMVLWSKIPHIGEPVAFQQPGRAPLEGVIRWVRDGRVGIHFTVIGE